ncbi:MAG: strawberry notch family protein, partial [Hyphomicrobiales bacterium]|nr:strawberry notch family protein [Hyphomicrobiales bacterium]
MNFFPSYPAVVDAERLDGFAVAPASALPVSVTPSPVTHSPLLTSLATSQPLKAQCLLAAARLLQAHLERGQRLDAVCLRAAMEAAFGGSDQAGLWDWKSAYEAVEAATILFLRKFGPSLRERAPTSAAMLGMLNRIGGLLPTQTRRSEESEAMQQFSTPIPLGYAASLAAAITPQDLVLEPSAGTGLLAFMAELAGGSLMLNELAATRADMLAELFSHAPLTRFDGARIDDYLRHAARPSVVLMNPPFSALQHVEQRVGDVALRHISSSLDRLVEGGRLVAITGANCSPHHAAWRDAFETLQRKGRVVFTCALAGAAYAKHGTTFETRLTVIDRLPAENPNQFPAILDRAEDAAMLLKRIEAHVPARPPFKPDARAATMRQAATLFSPSKPLSHPASKLPAVRPLAPIAIIGIELAYETRDWTPPSAEHLTETLYEDYVAQSIIIPGALPHPTRLVQSAAMASVTPPKPSYRPRLPEAIIAKGLLSDAQLESVILAGEAHQGYLSGCWRVDETLDKVCAVPENTDGTVRFRKGWFLGDGTGAGKGRQVAGIVLDNWCQGRRRALWVSKSDKLMEDAQRDWAALGQERLQITPQSRFAQGTPIKLSEGILFTTYATLRSEGRGGKASRLQQIVDWLGRDFEGVIIFDESHAMQNAAGSKNELGETEGSQQGRAGLRLQHALPQARIVYVSATGATSVHNLAYAQRLGLWGGTDFPFSSREAFVGAIEAGGVAAMEVLARDMKALGLYSARSLSYHGVTYEPLAHQLTEAQVQIYDAYAGAFAIIHQNLEAALEANGITSETGTLNRQAKAAAKSAFESAKQRFFNHLITAMKIPTLIAAIEHDLGLGHACVIQIVSTSEALMERRLALIPSSEWNDLSIDITPREYVLDYLSSSFPTQLYEPFTAEDGKISSRPATIDGQPVICGEAEARRDQLIEHLAALAPVPGALDQIIQHFGTDAVAEITGRSRRIIRQRGADGVDRLKVENRAGSANLAETQAFMQDEKRILIFSDAGGTGRSYHADLSAKNQRLRVHYLLEPGWKADAAIQGLGRTNRTHQAQPPLFRPVVTNVKGEKRFVSTIARRLDTLGAMTRGQRQTGGQGMFRSSDNLESTYARAALRQLYYLLVM